MVSNKVARCILSNYKEDVSVNSAASSIIVKTEGTDIAVGCGKISVTAPVGGAAISNNALNNDAPVAACSSFSVTEGTVCSLNGGIDNIMFSSIADDGSKDRIIATQMRQHLYLLVNYSVVQEKIHLVLMKA